MVEWKAGIEPSGRKTVVLIRYLVANTRCCNEQALQDYDLLCFVACYLHGVFLFLVLPLSIRSDKEKAANLRILRIHPPFSGIARES